MAKKSVKKKVDKAAYEKKIAKAMQNQVALTVFGNVPDLVVINPDEKKNRLTEAVGATAVFTFGRMNPPTKGHEFLVQRIRKMAAEKQAVPLVYLSHSNDKTRDPFDYKTKVKLAKKAFGADIIKVSNAKNIIAVLEDLRKNFSRIFMMVGSDRETEFRNVLTDYNLNTKAFSEVHVVSIGDRDPDSPGMKGASASLLRDYARNGQLAMFAKGLPEPLVDDHLKIYQELRKAMGVVTVSEEVDPSIGLREAIETRRAVDKMGFSTVEPRKTNNKRIAKHQRNKPAIDTLDNKTDSESEINKTAEGRAMGRVYADMAKRGGMDGVQNPNPEVMASDMDRLSSEFGKYNTYLDQEKRFEKTKGTADRSKIKEEAMEPETSMKIRLTKTGRQYSRDGVRSAEAEAREKMFSPNKDTRDRAMATLRDARALRKKGTFSENAGQALRKAGSVAAALGLVGGSAMIRDQAAKRISRNKMVNRARREYRRTIDRMS